MTDIDSSIKYNIVNLFEAILCEYSTRDGYERMDGIQRDDEISTGAVEYTPSQRQ